MLATIYAIIPTIFLTLISSATGQGQGFAIVELFTSQGCSSCPAADLNLTELLKRYQSQGAPVYGLSFHVDYWNHLGWKDPYSSMQFTDRQKGYARRMNLESIYTPQMIINGTTELIGSDKTLAEKKVADALLQNQKYQIELTNVHRTEKKLTLHYQLDRPASGEFLNIALIEREIGNAVTGGENTGRTLHHNNVVRSFITLPLKLEGDIDIALPEKGTVTSVVLYIQDEKWRVIGASSKGI